MKRIIALTLCLGFAFVVTGCKQKQATPEEKEQQISQKLADSKYVDAHITGDMSMDIPNAGQQKVTLNADYKSDISSGFPKMLINGTVGLEGLMSITLGFYMDENKTQISLMGDSEETPIPEESREQIKAALGGNGVQPNLNKTVKETKYNEQNALEITYDVSTINQLVNNSGAQSQQTVINSLVVYYLLTNKNDLDSMVIKANFTSAGSPMDMNLTAKINSLGTPVEITPFSVNTPATEGASESLNLLTSQKSAA